MRVSWASLIGEAPRCQRSPTRPSSGVEPALVEHLALVLGGSAHDQLDASRGRRAPTRMWSRPASKIVRRRVLHPGSLDSRAGGSRGTTPFQPVASTATSEGGVISVAWAAPGRARGARVARRRPASAGAGRATRGACSPCRTNAPSGRSASGAAWRRWPRDAGSMRSAWSRASIASAPTWPGWSSRQSAAEAVVVLPPAERTRPVPGGEGGRLVEEEELGEAPGLQERAAQPARGTRAGRRSSVSSANRRRIRPESSWRQPRLP